MKSDEIRNRFLKFFEKRGHIITPSASLVPQNDPSVLFNTAGMQPLVPYLLGETHPLGQRIVNVQKCVRTGDLEDIGDNRHFSFFEMLGNWSLGDYFKEEAILWSYEFLTSKEEGLGLDVNRLYFTVFQGDENAPFDEESKKIWMSLGIPEHRIYALPASDNWWSPGDNGPCGPCSEMFYDMRGDMGDLSKEEFLEAQDREDVIEIWNDVFMEYEKKDGKVIGKLKQKNVDTGAGLERITAVMQGQNTAYDTDLFSSASEVIGVDQLEISDSEREIVKARRIVLDHLRTALFLASDGVFPSNKDRGYVMRRLIRRGCIYLRKIAPFGIMDIYPKILDAYVLQFKEFYPNLVEVQKTNYKVILEEVEKFSKTLEQGYKEFEKGTDPFILATTYGFPIEVILEIANEKNIKIDLDDFNKKMSEHQKLSQTASAGMFKGGLANHNEKTIKLHTAHHLLLAALQAVVDKNIKQRGSNITEERLRIDFLCDHKLTDLEKQKVEDWVNDKIKRKLNVIRREMSLKEAEQIGAEMEFGAKYPDMVSVYFIEDEYGNVISKEFCGGPHVKNTAELYSLSKIQLRDKESVLDGIEPFKILKEEAVSVGIRRIKATLK